MKTRRHLSAASTKEDSDSGDPDALKAPPLRARAPEVTLTETAAPTQPPAPHHSSVSVHHGLTCALALFGVGVVRLLSTGSSEARSGRAQGLSPRGDAAATRGKSRRVS